MNWDRLFYDNEGLRIGRGGDRHRKGTRAQCGPLQFPSLHRAGLLPRLFAQASISDWKRRYLELCDDCELKAGCGGFFEWYPEERGFSRLGLS